MMDTANDSSGSRLQFGEDEIRIRENEIEELLSVSSDDVSSPETLSVAKKRISAADDGMPVHLYVLHIFSIRRATHR